MDNPVSDKDKKYQKSKILRKSYEGIKRNETKMYVSFNNSSSIIS